MKKRLTKKLRLKPRRGHGKQKAGHKNPLFTSMGGLAGVGLEDMDKFLSNTAGNMAVTAALSGCTLNEKLLISAIIPTLITIVRSVPKDKVADAVEKMYSEEPEPEEGGAA